MLNSLQVTNFRAFRDLRVEHLGKVNLIVGRNNVGKTTLLEAIHIYSSADDVLDAVIRLLNRRQEYSIEKGHDVLSLESLFCQTSEKTIEICEVNSEHPLVLRRQWSWMEEERDGLSIFKSRKYSIEPSGYLGEAEVLTVNYDNTALFQSLPLHVEHSHYQAPYRGSKEGDRNVFVPATGLQDDSIDPAELWDRVILTDRENSVLDVLKVIEPTLDRIVMVQGKRARRIAMAKLLNKKTMPLRSLGEGMNRLFELALGLVNVQSGGVFLIDEIDSGLHFTTLVDVWSIVFDAAVRLNVQVFATTHSWECIEAFQRAATEHPEEGVLIRLEREADGISAESFSEEELAIITRESIEVR